MVAVMAPAGLLPGERTARTPEERFFGRAFIARLLIGEGLLYPEEADIGDMERGVWAPRLRAASGGLRDRFRFRVATRMVTTVGGKEGRKRGKGGRGDPTSTKAEGALWRSRYKEGGMGCT